MQEAIFTTFSCIRCNLDDFFAYPTLFWRLFRVSDAILTTFSRIRCNFDDFFAYPLLFLLPPLAHKTSAHKKPRTRACTKSANYCSRNFFYQIQSVFIDVHWIFLIFAWFSFSMKLTGQRFEGRVSQKVKLSPDFHFPVTFFHETYGTTFWRWSIPKS